jgi:[ribosomal protein S18]-alanine N-acetyltransferase
VFNLRPYQGPDFDELWRLDQICFAHGIAYTRPELRHFLLAKSAISIVAEKAGSIAGFLIADIHERHAHVITIDILPEHRRAGLGSLLMAAAEKQMRAAKVRDVALEVAVDNHAAITFYKRHGYDVLKTIPRYYNNEIDALLMGKKLKSEQVSNAQP